MDKLLARFADSFWIAADWLYRRPLWVWPWMMVAIVIIYGALDPDCCGGGYDIEP